MRVVENELQKEAERLFKKSIVLLKQFEEMKKMMKQMTSMHKKR